MEVHLKQKRSEKPLLRKNIIEKTAYLCTTDRLSFFLIIMNKILMQAKEDAKETIRVMRYRDDQSGYFWIDDTDYTLVMHPILSEQEGNNRYELEDQNGIMIIQEIMKVCQSAEKGGYNEFYFTKAGGYRCTVKEDPELCGKDVRGESDNLCGGKAEKRNRPDSRCVKNRTGQYACSSSGDYRII